MAGWRSWVAAGVAGVVLFGATLWYCAEPGQAFSAESRPPISTVARWLTVPVWLANSSELRAYCLPVGAAVLLVLAALGWGGPGSAGFERPRGATAWAAGLLIAAGVAAAVSSVVNSTWEMSRGWVYQLAVGGLWAAGLAMTVDRAAARRVLVLAGGVGLLATGLTLWHRWVLGIEYVRWPIGPLTISGSMGGVWAAMAAGAIGAGVAGGLRGGRRRWAAIGAAAGVLLICVYLVGVSGRRGSLLGVAGGVGVSAATALWAVAPGRRTRWIVAGGMAAGVAIAGLWIGRQMGSSVREVSGPLVLRQVYWGAARDLIREKPLLGIGPDMTMCRVTTAVALRRAEEPWVVHGNVVPALHNEWLQAALELGVPGGLAYLALPLVVMVAAARAAAGGGMAGRSTGVRSSVDSGAESRDVGGERAWVLAACAAGLTAMVVIEATSINLRGPVMSAWYWTLLGVAAAMLRVGRGGAAAARDAKVTGASRLPQIVSLGAAAGVLFLAIGDFQQVSAHAEATRIAAAGTGEAKVEAAGRLELAAGRFGVEGWIKARVDRAMLLTDLTKDRQRRAKAVDQMAKGPGAASQPASQAAADAASPPTTRPAVSAAARAEIDRNLQLAAEQAVSAWLEVVTWCEGYPAGAGFLADALLMAGRREDAKVVLGRSLAKLDPYDPAANLLWAGQFAATPAEKVEDVRRGLRAGAVEAIGRRFFLTAIRDEATRALWDARVAQARADVAAGGPEAWKDALAPETLRLEAVRLMAAGELPAAAAAQRSAAETYRRLRDENHRLRRAGAAEVDAWQILAEVTFRSDPGAWREAYEAVCAAELFAVRTVEHEYMRRVEPGLEFVGGKIRPVETPDRLVPLWRLSAKLHLAAGREALKDPASPASVGNLKPRLVNAMTQAERATIMEREGTLENAIGLMRLRLMVELLNACKGLPAARRPVDYALWEEEVGGAKRE